MGLTTIFSACDCTCAFIGGAVLLFVTYLLLQRKPRNFPPGPSGIPLLGYAPFFGKNAAEDIRKLKYKYGPVMSMQMGTEQWVVLNDFHSLNEVLGMCIERIFPNC